MLIADLPALTYRGEVIDPDVCGVMLDCMPLLDDVEALRQHAAATGYVYLPGYFEREDVLNARRIMTAKLARLGAIKPGTDPMDSIYNPGSEVGFSGGRVEAMFDEWEPIHNLLYAGRMMDFFRLFLGGPVLHYDYTWNRQVKPGPSTYIHSDVVYMGRGTHRLYTAWVPIGDATFDMGGLLLLEGSNQHQGLQKGYWKSDVDSFCENRPGKKDAWAKGQEGWLKGSAAQLRKSLGIQGRWLTANYRAGDLVVFDVYTVHGGTDNHSDRIRLSTDSRYQLAHEAVDERWIGENPAGHGPGGKRGRIC